MNIMPKLETFVKPNENILLLNCSPAEVRALTGDVKVFNTAMSRLRRVNQQDPEATGESLK